MRPVALVVLACVTFGCGKSATRDAAGDARPAPPFVTRTEESELQLPGQGGNLRIGESFALAETRFPRPSQAFAFDALPSPLASPYTAVGWELSAEGFGAIGYSRVLALAMQHRQSIPQKEFEAHLAELTRVNPSRVVTRSKSGAVERWRWEDGLDALEVQMAPSRLGNVSMTTVLGDRAVMSALGFPSEAPAERSPRTATP